MRIAVLALGLAIAAGACASSGTAAADQTATAQSTTRRTNVITTQEIRDSRAPILPDLIRQLRPSWPDPNQVNVVVNNDIMNLGPGEGLSMLRNQPVSSAPSGNAHLPSRSRIIGASMTIAARIPPPSTGATRLTPAPNAANTVRIASTMMTRPFGVRKNRPSRFRFTW